MEYALTVERGPRTGRLLLRAWEEQDIPALVEAYRDPEMRRWMRTSVRTAADARRLVEARRAAQKAGDRLSFAILEATGESTGEDTDEGAVRELAGGISLRGLGDGSGKAEVGYWVAAQRRGRGIAPLALDALCEWAFCLPLTPRLMRVDLIHDVGNRASCRVAEKASFVLSGVLPAAPPEYPAEGHLHVRAPKAGL